MIPIKKYQSNEIAKLDAITSTYIKVKLPDKKQRIFNNRKAKRSAKRYLIRNKFNEALGLLGSEFTCNSCNGRLAIMNDEMVNRANANDPTLMLTHGNKDQKKIPCQCIKCGQEQEITVKSEKEYDRYMKTTAEAQKD